MQKLLGVASHEQDSRKDEIPQDLKPVQQHQVIRGALSFENV
jgi:hypothetical protein